MSTPPLGSRGARNKPTICIWGEARISQQIVQVPEKHDGEHGEDGAAALTLRDFYLPTGTFLIQELIAAVREIAKMEAERKAAKQEKKTGKSKHRAPLVRPEEAYLIYGPKDAPPEILAALPRDTIIIRSCKSRRDPKSNHRVYRIGQYLGVREPSAKPHGSTHRIPRSAAARLDLFCLDFDQFGLDGPDLFDSVGLRPGDRAAPLHRFLFKVKNYAGWHKRGTNFAQLERSLTAFVDEHSRASISLISAEELRQLGKPISYQVSWERTIQSTLWVLKSLSSGDNRFEFATRCRYVVVTYGCDAAIIIENEPGKYAPRRAMLVLEPSSTEGDHIHRFSPRMRGFDSLVTAGIAHCLMESLLDPHRAGLPTDASELHPIVTGVVRGLKASRLLQVRGFDDLARDGVKGKRRSEYPSLFAAHESLRPWKFSEQYCDSAKELFRKRDVTSWSFDVEKAVVFPIDVTACVLATGGIGRYSWFPFRPETEAEMRFLRKFGERLMEDWEAAGQLHCQYLSAAELRIVREGMVRKAAPEAPPALRALADQPSFDKHWWSFVDIFIASELLAVNRRKQPGDLTEVVAMQLAELILKKGVDWISRRSRDPRKDIRRAMLERCADVRHVDTRTVLARISGRLKQYSTQLFRGRPPRSDDFRKDIEDLRVSHGVAAMESPGISGILPILKIGKLETLDRRESENFRNFSSVIREYFERRPDKPLNLGVFGPAGAGKTFSVTEICENAGALSGERITRLSFNLSQLGNPEHLTDAFEEIQDYGIRGTMPVVFWDEFDTAIGDNKLAWLSYFLGPMNDAVYFKRERTRRLPRAIFVFAGSLFTSYTSMMALDWLSRDHHDAKVDRFTVSDWLKAKGPDFKSRLSGVLDVQGVNPQQRVSVALREGREKAKMLDLGLPVDPHGHLIRRAIILRRELEKRNPQLFDEEKDLRIDPGVLRAFLDIKEYYHGSRSIEQLVAMSNFEDRDQLNPSCLPSASQLRVHVNPKEFEQPYREAVV